MAANPTGPKLPILLDLYRPAIFRSPPGLQFRSHLRRANEHLTQLKKMVTKLQESGDCVAEWKQSHEEVAFEKKWRLEVCLRHVEDYVRSNPGSAFEDEVESLRKEWQHLNQVLGSMTSSSVVCTNPDGQAKK